MRLHMEARLGNAVTDRVMTKPYESAPGFKEGWWGGNAIGGDGLVWFAFTDEAGDEVARAEVETHSTSGDHYAGVEIPPSGFARVHLFEVREDRRRHGIGSAAVELLQAAFPHTRMSAFSEGGDAFWAGLGWRRYVHPDEVVDREPAHQLFFTSPPFPAE